MFQKIICLFSFGLVLCISPKANAQLKVGVHGGAGFATGQLGSFSKVGYGVGISGEYLLLEKHVGLGLTAHLYSFEFRYLAGAGHTTIAPICLFGKYYFSNKAVNPYIGLELGEYYVNISDNLNPYPNGKLNPGMAPMGGFVFRLSDQVELNLVAKYNIIFSSTYANASTFTFMAVNAGTAITFGK